MLSLFSAAPAFQGAIVPAQAQRASSVRMADAGLEDLAKKVRLAHLLQPNYPLQLARLARLAAPWLQHHRLRGQAAGAAAAPGSGPASLKERILCRARS